MVAIVAALCIFPSALMVIGPVVAAVAGSRAGAIAPILVGETLSLVIWTAGAAVTGACMVVGMVDLSAIFPCTIDCLAVEARAIRARKTLFTGPAWWLFANVWAHIVSLSPLFVKISGHSSFHRAVPLRMCFNVVDRSDFQDACIVYLPSVFPHPLRSGDAHLCLYTGQLRGGASLIVYHRIPMIQHACFPYS